MKFETASFQNALDFIMAKGLHQGNSNSKHQTHVRIKATGGGAYKFADMFQVLVGSITSH